MDKFVLTPEMQNAIVALIKVAWEAYGKDLAKQLLDKIISTFEGSDFLLNLYNIFQANEVNWQEYIINDDICEEV